MQVTQFGFSDINWGPDTAEEDYGLSNYFVEYPGYSEVLEGKLRYIIGRKGTGKSAILQKIRTLSEDKPDVFCTSVSLRDFPINDFKSMGDSKYRDKSKYVPAWKFLILVELSKLIVNDCSVADGIEKEQLNDFLNLNFPDGIGMVETISMLKEHTNKISVLTNWIAGDFNNKHSEQRTANIHFQSAIKILEQLIYSFNIRSKYYILADELDEGYKDTDSNLKLIILSLLRANEELALYFKNCKVKCFPIVALRSDIFDNLSDNDLNKLDDYLLRLNWTIKEDGNQSLKRIVESRMKYSYNCKYPAENIDAALLWNVVFDENSAQKGLWKYMAIHTFDRPRDIIKLLKYCQKDSLNIKRLDLKMVKDIEMNYSSWLYREFRDEVQSYLPCWRSVLNCLTEISYGKEKIEKLNQVLSDNSEIKNWLIENKKDASYIIQILFNYSVIGCINDKGRWIFKYKDDYAEIMPSYQYYCVHYGFCEKLRIINSYKETVLTEIYYSTT